MLVPARERLGIGDVVLVVSNPDAVALFDVLRQSGARLVEVMAPAMDAPAAGK